MANVEVVDTFSDHASLDLPSNLGFIKQFYIYIVVHKTNEVD